MSVKEICYYRLKIETANSLNPEWSFPTPTGDYGIWSVESTTMFTPEWLNYVSNLGLNIKHALVFYRAPFTTSKVAHVDTHIKDLKKVNFAINWVVGGKESSMHWYTLPTEEGVFKDVDSSSPYLTYKFDEIKYIESCRIQDQVTLVRTNLPHAITMGSDPRWCISARTHISEDIPWDEVANLFRSKNLLVER